MKSWPLLSTTRITRLDRQSLATAHWPSGCENIHSVSRPCATQPDFTQGHEVSESIIDFMAPIIAQSLADYQACKSTSQSVYVAHAAGPLIDARLGHHEDTALSERPVGGDALHV